MIKLPESRQWIEVSDCSKSAWTPYQANEVIDCMEAEPHITHWQLRGVAPGSVAHVVGMHDLGMARVAFHAWSP